MAIYAIGDIQGCFKEFKLLLEHIQFSPHQDFLWFTGDLVNRGPHSLEVLRFVKDLGERCVVILGNHDLHLIAAAYGFQKIRQNETLGPVLTAPDKNALIDWLRMRPLLHVDQATGYVMSHAGLAPMWSLSKAISLAKEVEAVLHGPNPEALLENMYGNFPDLWVDDLTGIDRLRCIINYLTRMRFCYADGRLDLTYKGAMHNKPHYVMPWFDVPHRANSDVKIIFGHWAALAGKADVLNIYPLDTGCVWGNFLTGMRLGDDKRFTVKSLSGPR